MQAAVVHDGGVGQDPPYKQKRLAFKFASAAWVDAGGGAESKWKEMHPSEQRAMPGADTRAGATAAAWRASHAPVSARVVVLTVAGGSTGLVVYCTTHLPPGRPLQGGCTRRPSCTWT